MDNWLALFDGQTRYLDGTGYLHLEDVPPGSVQVEFGSDTRNYLRKKIRPIISRLLGHLSARQTLTH
ncbi:hypothetical protein [Enterobacter chuandaensis]|uniref:Uncharacterized protein n=1 Tax=Enterobacter chuandaensis TaxID=2497875 RepID=A0AA96RVL1_9ENTR|nr:hypothetical protein [Enterobacter chuandaensis]MCW4781367.1 hypothetical protein [Enterobacter chuandaensis]MDA4759219.1 hypothetical protein [Enterobacter chuandaensis]WNS39562.1 hypothetical protein RQP59_08425 [Enterobacter chuandaensis]